MTSSYYHPEHLTNFGQIAQGNPELAQKFFSYYQAVFEEGALSKREKALIALAVAHAVQCPYCIEAYSKASLQEGSDLEQMTEAVHIATAIRGGASLIHGLQMLDQVNQLSFWILSCKKRRLGRTEWNPTDLETGLL